MAALTGQQINLSYIDLLQVSNSNTGVDATLRSVSDGQDTVSALQLSTTTVAITGELQHVGDADTKIAFTDDAITLSAGGVTFLTLTESTSDTITVGVEMNMNGNNITDVHEVQLDGVPDTDHTANGPTTNSFNAGATIAIGEVVYFDPTALEWLLTDADAVGTSGSVMLAIALEAGTDGAAMKVALPGSFVRDDTWAWTPGAELYLSTTPGDLTETAPSATGDVIRVVGYAMSADVVYFFPSGAWATAA